MNCNFSDNFNNTRLNYLISIFWPNPSSIRLWRTEMQCYNMWAHNLIRIPGLKSNLRPLGFEYQNITKTSTELPRPVKFNYMLNQFHRYKKS